MKASTCIVIVFIIIWPLAINAQNTYRDEIIEHAIKKCFTVIVSDLKLAKQLNMSEQKVVLLLVNSIPNDELSKTMRSILLDVLNQSTRTRLDAHNRYAAICAKSMKQGIVEIISK